MGSSFSLHHIAEPLLEFAGGARHLDMRFGLMDYGPVDFSTDRTKEVRLGIVGSGRTIEGFRTWMERCKEEIPAKKSNQPHLFPAFPGIGIGGPFRCYFELDTRDERPIQAGRLGKITAEERDEAAVRMAVEVFEEEIRSLAESERPPQAIVCALPVEIIERVKNMRRSPVGNGEPEEGSEDEGREEEDERLAEDFRGALKAASLTYRVPIQIVWPTTYDNNAVIKRKLAKLSERTVQDEATRAWNLFGALYYKAGGTPWRMVRDPRDYPALYMGISFYEEFGRGALQTSSAQLFDERGEGLILKGGAALKDKADRQPYLSEENAYALLRAALGTYKREWRNFPSRLVIHKSSRFRDQEARGFGQAIDEVGIESADFIWLPRRSPSASCGRATTRRCAAPP